MAYEVTVDVFGIYTHGKLAGRTNPKQSVSLTMYGDTVKVALGKINRECGGATHVVRQTRDLSRVSTSAPALAAIAA